MTIDILTLFPEMFKGPFDESIVKRAVDNGLVEINIHNIRDYSVDSYNTVDDHPYGGGPGMVMRVDVINRAMHDLNAKRKTQNSKIILMSAKGKRFNQQMAQEYAKLEKLVLIAGHYEGVDERVAENLVDEEVRIGDFVLTGGELPVMCIVDSVVRHLPGVIKPDSLATESHSNEGLLEYPQYTRPAEYNGWKVPEVLLNGNHAEIEKWRREKMKKEK
jgi:tRNA (guanine37-N1)-methyltransferase